MSSRHIDPERVETVLEECLEEMEVDDSKFTCWEMTFLESIENFINDHIITDSQWEKLQQIYEEKVA